MDEAILESNRRWFIKREWCCWYIPLLLDCWVLLACTYSVLLIGHYIVGVLEANFIEPAHDKQDFERSLLFIRLESRLKQMIMDYWFVIFIFFLEYFFFRPFNQLFVDYSCIWLFTKSDLNWCFRCWFSFNVLGVVLLVQVTTYLGIRMAAGICILRGLIVIKRMWWKRN